MVFGKKNKGKTAVLYDFHSAMSEKEEFVERWVHVHQPFMASQRMVYQASGSGVTPIYYSIDEIDDLPESPEPVENSDDGYMSISDMPLRLEDLSSKDSNSSLNTGNYVRRGSKTEEWAQWRKEVNTQLASEILAKKDGVKFEKRNRQVGKLSASSMERIAQEARGKAAPTHDFLMYGMPRVILSSKR